jgi:response regulator of citrate/malate metabolism
MLSQPKERNIILIYSFLHQGGFMKTNKTHKKSRADNPKILIVEDDKTLEPIWDYVTTKVNNHSKVDWATSELEAEDLIFEAQRDGRQYDLVIVDIFLEGSRTGLDLYEKFGHLFHNKMIITSSADYEKYSEYLQAGTFRPYCLEKPLVPDECVSVVNRMLH